MLHEFKDRLCFVLGHIWAYYNAICDKTKPYACWEQHILGMHCIVFIRICFTELYWYTSHVSNGLQWALVLHKNQCLLDPWQFLLRSAFCAVSGLCVRMWNVIQTHTEMGCWDLLKLPVINFRPWMRRIVEFSWL